MVAEGEHRLKFRTGGLEADKFPSPEQLAGWIDAALDRETPFKCTAGLHHAIAHRDHHTGFPHHGFLNVLLATRQAFDGASVSEVATLLADHYPNDLVALARTSRPRGCASVVHLVRLVQRPGAARRPRRPGPRRARRREPREQLGRRRERVGVRRRQPAVRRVRARSGEEPRVGARIGDFVLDLAPVAAAEMLDVHAVFGEPTLNEFLRQGRPVWDSIRTWLVGLVTDEAERDLVEPHLVPLEEVELRMPFEVGDYVDFYASLDHASNVGRIFRPDQEPLLPNWRHLPSATTAAAAPSCRAGRPSSGRAASAGRRTGTTAPSSGRAPGSTSRPSSASSIGGSSRLGEPIAADRLRRPRVRRGRPQRLVGPRHPGLGVRAARTVPRQVVRHLDLGLGHPAGGARRRVDRPARPGPGAAPLPRARRHPGSRHRRRDRPERRGRQPAAVPHDVLVTRRRCSPT